MLLGSAGSWPQHLGAIQKAWYFATHSQSISKTGRKNRKREGTQDNGVTYVTIPVPNSSLTDYIYPISYKNAKKANPMKRICPIKTISQQFQGTDICIFIAGIGNGVHL